MSALMLFVVLLIIGIAFLICSKKLKGTGKAILIIISIVICLFALFGLITVFL
ncbi:MAG: hypothetical protein MSA76_11710 [Clostridium sp.]|nr:hypothetical protein [Lachnospiraceae bacterium]MCI7504284.1 hypothetical protein [Clostridium sp.]